MFERKVDLTILEKLSKEDLFKDYLLPDIKTGLVFPAIRKNEIHFYYKGGRIFKFSSNGFESNVKYISVANTDNSGDITEKELSKIELIRNFKDGYKRIKENCEKFNQKSEAHNVSYLYKYSYAGNDYLKDIVLLDIEVSFGSQKEDSSQDRIDILLYDLNQRVLRFYEAKLFNNKEIRSKSAPKVIRQIKRYNNQLSKNKKNILKQYGNYIKTMNILLNKNLLSPVGLEEIACLFVCDFDSTQLSSTTLKDLKKSCMENNINWYFKGDASSINIENMWTALCK